MFSNKGDYYQIIFESILKFLKLLTDFDPNISILTKGSTDNNFYMEINHLNVNIRKSNGEWKTFKLKDLQNFKDAIKLILARSSVKINDIDNIQMILTMPVKPKNFDRVNGLKPDVDQDNFIYNISMRDFLKISKNYESVI